MKVTFGPCILSCSPLAVHPPPPSSLNAGSYIISNKLKNDITSVLNNNICLFHKNVNDFLIKILEKCTFSLNSINLKYGFTVVVSDNPLHETRYNPLVDDFKIQRTLTGQVTITIEEAKPLFFYNHENIIYFIC